MVKMKREEILSLKKNGVEYDRINTLKSQLRGYDDIKKEVDKLMTIILSKDKEIISLKRKVKYHMKKKLLDGLR